MAVSKLMPRLEVRSALGGVFGVLLFFVGLVWSPSQERWPILFVCFSFTLIVYSIVAQCLHRLKHEVADIADRFDFERTGSGDRNWHAAIEMTQHPAEGWEALDTTSGINREDFEREVEAALARGCVYYRIICGNPVSENTVSQSGEAAWLGLKKILDPLSDRDGDRAKFRQAIEAGKFKMLHLARPMEIDLYVVRHGMEATEALLGFSKEIAVVNEEPYTSGLRFRNRGVAGDLALHFQSVLWERARQHVKQAYERKRRGEDHCFCADFFDPGRGCLIPQRGRL